MLVAKTIRQNYVLINFQYVIELHIELILAILAVWHITIGLNLVFMKANHSRLSALYFLLSIILTFNY